VTITPAVQTQGNLTFGSVDSETEQTFLMEV